MQDRIKIVVAETSPVIATGMAGCLRRLTSLRLQVVEARTADDLMQCIESVEPDILLVNPNFQGTFNLRALREKSGKDFKAIAIETGKLDSYVTAQFDGVISIVDNLETISQKISVLTADEAETESDDPEEKEKESLSQREKEIVTLVVKGLTNKEIADKLFLSIHTVITHRRNIARKLDIHSSTGLTIYAIVNKLVDLHEIKI